MAAIFQNIQTALMTLWARLTVAQRLTIGALLLVSIVAAALLAMWASTPSYGVLFSGLSSADAGAITTQLSANKVPYQLADGGATILVPQADVDAQRIQLANQGLPQSDTVGWGIFDKQNMLTGGDPFTQQINYTRALEGELTRTIGQVDGVQYARVNLNVPQDQLFSSQQSNPTASVLLKLAPGASLSSDQIAGVQHLVASAVQGMKSSDVTIVDGNGTILTNGDTAGGVSAAGLTALTAESHYASALEARIAAMLDTVLGPGHAVVRVDDTMDWTQSESTSNVYTPQAANSPLSEQQVITNSSTGPANAVGGLAGLPSNVPTYGTSGITGTLGVTQRSANIHNIYANSNTVTHRISTPGALTRLSVAVMLDSGSAVVASPATVAKIKTAVAAAAGIVPARGDTLDVVPVAFDTTLSKQAAAAAAQAALMAFITNIVRWASLLVVPLILLFLLRRLLLPAEEEEDDEDELPNIEVHEAATPLLASAAQRSEMERQQQLLRQSVADLAREKPDMVAGLIGRWIDEDRG